MDTRLSWRLKPANALAAGVLCIGVTLFAYPSAAAWVAQHNHANIVHDQARVDASRTRSELERLEAEARDYNAHLAATLGAGTWAGLGERADTAEVRPDDHPDGAPRDVLRAPPEYWQTLAPGPNGVMARLTVPRIEMDLPIYHGTSEATLLKGAGHLQGTSLPIGGAGSRAVITGHRGLASAEMFTRLDELEPADTFAIEALGETRRYRVTRVQVVEPDETEEIRPVPGSDLVTLVTCTPLGINSHRILVTGEREHAAAGKATGGIAPQPRRPGAPVWAAWWGGGVAVALLWPVCAGFQRQCGPRPSRNSKKTRASAPK